MTDLELLFLVLVVIYGWECAGWLPRGSLGFVNWLGPRWRLKQVPNLLGNQKGGFIFASPLPPLGAICVATPLPLSLSPCSVLAFVAPNLNNGPRPQQSGKLISFTTLRTVQVQGRKLLLNGDLFLKTSTPTFAEYLASNLRQLRDAAPETRAQKIEQMLKAGLDTRALQKRWADFQARLNPVRLLTNALFFYLFAFAPGLIWAVGLAQCWLALLVGVFILTLATALCFRLVHKEFYPAAEDERFTHFITILLSPATAIRARDVLSRPLLETFHPLAIAQSFCPETEFLAFARKVIIEFRHPALPLAPGQDEVAREAEESFRSTFRRLIEKFLKQNGVEVEQLTRPPDPADESCLSFCPRCEAQFTSRLGSCPDCGGLALVPFSSPNRSSTARRK
jgi:hypothetical protein